MKHEIDVAIRSRDWLDVLTNCEQVCKSAVVAALESQSTVESSTEVSVVLADDTCVQGLNKRFRGKDVPTNVLSFPTNEGISDRNLPHHLGEIVLAFGTCYKEFDDSDSIEFFYHHISHMVVHGMLHLLGFDHSNNLDAERMECMEIDILSGIGVPSPYVLGLEVDR